MKRVWLIPVFICIFLLAFVGWVLVQDNAQRYVPFGGQSKLPMKAIQIGTTAIFAEVASTELQKNAGLSGRLSLPDGAGMLFEFDSPVVSGFWMKDMRFPLDIIWADASGTIVTIYSDLPPQSYPNIFRPTEPAKYVLELPAGFVAKHGIAIGQKIVL